MERIDISNLAKICEEPRGHGLKYWVYDDGAKLVKFNGPMCRDCDVMESIASVILRLVGIDAVDVELGQTFDKNVVNKYSLDDNRCCLVPSFLTLEGDTLCDLPHRWPKVKTSDQMKNISSCFYKMFSGFTNLMGNTPENIENMKRDYVRQVFGDCIVQNEDRALRNIGIIYNEKYCNYRLAPSFDNGLAFANYQFISDEPLCFVGNQNFPSSLIIEYIIKNHLDYVDDIIVKLGELSSFGIDIVADNYKGEIPMGKLDYICDSIKDTYDLILDNVEKYYSKSNTL